MRLSAIGLVALLAGAAACGGAYDGPPAEELVGQARKLDLDGRSDEAVSVFRQALQADADSFDAHYGLARALDLTGSYDEAREHFARAIELASAGAREQALRMMGISWTFVRDADQAARYFRDVFDRRIAAANFAGAADEANELGRMYLELGDLDRAEEWYRRGFETAGRLTDQPERQVDLAAMRWAHAQARIAARRGQAELARQQSAVARALFDKGGNDDQRIQFPYLLGYVAYHLGDYAGALAELQNADQEDPFILMLLGEASEKLGDADGADGYYRKVLESSSHAINAAFARPVARAKLQGSPFEARLKWLTPRPDRRSNSIDTRYQISIP